LFEAVLFDSDGVLINSMPYHVKAWQSILGDYRIAVQPEWVLMAEGKKAEEVAVQILAKFGKEISDAELSRLVVKKQQTYRDLLAAKPEPGILPLLKRIKPLGWRTAIVTGSSRMNPVHGLGEDIVAHFDLLLGGEDVSLGKPAPECYLKAADMLNIRAEKCLVIENAPLGIEAAKSAGMTVVALSTTLDKSHLQAADFLYRDLQDLEANWDAFLSRASRESVTEST